MTSLADALPAQIKRISEKKARWEGYLRDHEMGPGLQLSINIMQFEIEQAVQSLASGDVIAMLRAHECLAAYSDDD
jgi:hypothetical protein